MGKATKAAQKWADAVTTELLSEQLRIIERRWGPRPLEADQTMIGLHVERTNGSRTVTVESRVDTLTREGVLFLNASVDFPDYYAVHVWRTRSMKDQS